jgi:hypothetical protein
LSPFGALWACASPASMAETPAVHSASVEIEYFIACLIENRMTAPLCLGGSNGISHDRSSQNDGAAHWRNSMAVA